MFSLQQFFLLISFAFLPGCATGYANNRPLTDEEETWKKTYTEAKALTLSQPKLACEKYTQLLNQEFEPAVGLKELVFVKQTQACNLSDDPLSKVTHDWLKAEAISMGLKNINKDYNRQLQYLKTEESLPNGEDLKLIYKELKQMAREALDWAIEKKDSNAITQILDYKPTLYVDYKFKIPEEKFEKLANDLRTEMRFDLAIMYYNKVIERSQKAINSTSNFKIQLPEYEKIYKAKMNIRQSYRLANNKELSLTQGKNTSLYFKNLYVKNPRPEFIKFYHDAIFQYVRDVWTIKTTAEAEKILDEAISFTGGKFTLSQLYWLKGRMAQEKKQIVTASEWFKKGLEQQSEKAIQINLQWSYAWNEYKQGNFKATESELEKLIDESEKISDFSTSFKAQYWLARAKEMNQDIDTAVEQYQETFENNMFGYYGFLSFVRLIEMGKGSLADIKFKEIETNPLISNKLATGYWLHLLGEQEISARFIIDYWTSLPVSQKNQANAESVLNLCELNKTYEPGQRVIVDLDNKTRKKLFEKSARWYFSTPHIDLVKPSAEKFNVDYEFVYSIMRQESLFNERARSVADAFGLLQLLPRVAELEAPEAGVNYKEPEDLYKPEVNIPIGTHHISKKRKTFKGSWVLSAAAYNAGDEPVRGWLKTRYNGNTLEFIEDIPYAETQGYAKMIFRNYSYYVLIEPSLGLDQKLEKINSYFQINLK